DILGAVGNLPLEIGEINGVEVHNPDLPDAGGGEIHGDRGAQSTGADAQHAGGFNFLLARQTDFRQDQVTRVAPDFVVAQLHSHNFKNRVGERKTDSR